MLNLVPDQNITLQVGTINCTNFLLNASGQYSQVSDSGLVIVTAKIELGNPIGNTTILDDRLNPSAWLRGVKVVLEIDNNLCPVIGTTYIDSSSYDIKEQVLTLNTTCLLGIANIITSSNLGVCVNISAGITYEQAITTLLTRANINPLDLDLDFTSIATQLTLVQHLFLGDNDSFIKLAGELARAMDFYLYQGSDGIIRASRVDRARSAIVISESVLSVYTYDRFQDQQQPPDTLRVFGQTISKEPYQTGNIATTPLGLPTLTQTREGRVLTSTSSSYGLASDVSPSFYGSGATTGIVVAARTITVDTYEDEGNPASEEFDAELGVCVPVDTGRLLTRLTQEYAPNAAAFEAYYQRGIEAGTFAEDFLPPLSQAVVRQTLETWEYNLATSQVSQFTIDLSEGVLQPDTLTNLEEESMLYTRRVREAIGTQAPVLGDPTLGTDTELVITPTTLEFAEFDSTTWTKKGGKWSSTTSKSVSRVKATPELIQSVIAQGELDAGTIYGIMFTPVVVSANTVLDDEPRTPGVIPPDFTYKAKDYVVAVTFNQLASSTVAPKRASEVSLGEYSSPTFAAEVGLGMGVLAWGRLKGAIVSLPLSAVPWNYQPLNHAYIEEFNNTKVEYATDGMSIVLTPDSAIATFQGLYFGSFQGSTPVPPVVSPSDPPLDNTINVNLPTYTDSALDVSSIDTLYISIVEPITGLTIQFSDLERYQVDLGYPVWGTIELAWLDSSGNYWIFT